MKRTFDTRARPRPRRQASESAQRSGWIIPITSDLGAIRPGTQSGATVQLLFIMAFCALVSCSFVLGAILRLSKAIGGYNQNMLQERSSQFLSFSGESKCANVRHFFAATQQQQCRQTVPLLDDHLPALDAQYKGGTLETDLVQRPNKKHNYTQTLSVSESSPKLVC